MKQSILNTLLATFLSISCCAQGSTLVILSPFQEPAKLTEQVAVAIELSLEMPQGEHITFINGETSNTLAKLTVPADVELANNPNSRIQHNAEPIARVGSFIASAGQDNRVSGALNLPATLRKISRYHRDAKDILIIGTARLDLTELSRRVRDGDHILLDENIQRPSSSLFGTADIPELMKGFRIHWWLTSDYQSRQVQQATQRFWHLWLFHQSGSLISYSEDKTIVLQRLKATAPPLAMPYQLNPAPVETALNNDTGSKQDTSSITKLFQRPLSTAKLAQEQWKQPQSVRVGISWQAQADLDIYATVNTDDDPVYFANPSHQGAMHVKDILTGKEGQSTRFETIQFENPVRLCELVIGINHYSGKVNKAINGLLRVEVRNQTWQVPFRIHASHSDNGMTNSLTGNIGADMQHVLKSGISSAHSLVFYSSDVIPGANSAECGHE